MVLTYHTRQHSKEGEEPQANKHSIPSVAMSCDEVIEGHQLRRAQKLFNVQIVQDEACTLSHGLTVILLARDMEAVMAITVKLVRKQT